MEGRDGNMRTQKEMQIEIRKLRLVFQNKKFPERARDMAWSNMLVLQWALSKKKDCSLGPLELCGISMVDAIGVTKQYKRQQNAER